MNFSANGSCNAIAADWSAAGGGGADGAGTPAAGVGGPSSTSPKLQCRIVAGSTWRRRARRRRSRYWWQQWLIVFAGSDRRGGCSTSIGRRFSGAGGGRRQFSGAGGRRWRVVASGRRLAAGPLCRWRRGHRCRRRTFPLTNLVTHAQESIIVALAPATARALAEVALVPSTAAEPDQKAASGAVGRRVHDDNGPRT